MTKRITAEFSEEQWLHVERIIRKAITGRWLVNDAEESLLHEAIVADKNRYRELHALVKRQEMDKINPWNAS